VIGACVRACVRDTCHGACLHLTSSRRASVGARVGASVGAEYSDDSMLYVVSLLEILFNTFSYRSLSSTSMMQLEVTWLCRELA